MNISVNVPECTYFDMQKIDTILYASSKVRFHEHHHLINLYKLRIETLYS